MNNVIGARIEGLLEERGEHQKELAKRVGITEASISRYINGEQIPGAISIGKIAKALDTTADYLISGNEYEIVKHGHWNCVNDTCGSCSVCKIISNKVPYMRKLGSGEILFCYEYPQYCPYCGAKMDGEENENSTL